MTRPSARSIVLCTSLDLEPGKSYKLNAYDHTLTLHDVSVRVLGLASYRDYCNQCREYGIEPEAHDPKHYPLYYSVLMD